MADVAELFIRFSLRTDTPNDVINILKYMLNQSECDPVLPTHEFFDKKRWRSIFIGFDDTEIGGKISLLQKAPYLSDGWELCVRSVYKDRGEIYSFFKWILPYIDETWTTFLGFIRYDTHPYLIYFIDDDVKFLKVTCEEEEIFKGNGKSDMNFNWDILSDE